MHDGHREYFWQTLQNPYIFLIGISEKSAIIKVCHLREKKESMIMRDGHEHMWWHGHGHMWWHGHEHMLTYGHGWGPAMPYIMLSNLFWMALFIALAVLLIHLLTTRNLPGEEYQSDILPDHPSALEPLRQGYARAEIDAVPLEQVQEQRVTPSWRKHRRHTDPLKDDHPLNWME